MPEKTRRWKAEGGEQRQFHSGWEHAALESDRPGLGSAFFAHPPCAFEQVLLLLWASVSMSGRGDGKTRPAGLFRALNEIMCAKLSAW